MKKYMLVVAVVPETETIAVIAAVSAAGGDASVSPIHWLDGRLPTRADLGSLAADIGDAAFEDEENTAIQEENNDHIPREEDK